MNALIQTIAQNWKVLGAGVAILFSTHKATAVLHLSKTIGAQPEPSSVYKPLLHDSLSVSGIETIQSGRSVCTPVFGELPVETVLSTYLPSPNTPPVNIFGYPNTVTYCLSGLRSVTPSECTVQDFTLFADSTPSGLSVINPLQEAWFWKIFALVIAVVLKCLFLPSKPFPYPDFNTSFNSWPDYIVVDGQKVITLFRVPEKKDSRLLRKPPHERNYNREKNIKAHMLWLKRQRDVANARANAVKEKNNLLEQQITELAEANQEGCDNGEAVERLSSMFDAAQQEKEDKLVGFTKVMSEKNELQVDLQSTRQKLETSEEHISLLENEIAAEKENSAQWHLEFTNLKLEKDAIQSVIDRQTLKLRNVQNANDVIGALLFTTMQQHESELYNLHAELAEHRRPKELKASDAQKPVSVTSGTRLDLENTNASTQTSEGIKYHHCQQQFPNDDFFTAIHAPLCKAKRKGAVTINCEHCRGRFSLDESFYRDHVPRCKDLHRHELVCRHCGACSSRKQWGKYFARDHEAECKKEKGGYIAREDAPVPLSGLLRDDDPRWKMGVPVPPSEVDDAINGVGQWIDVPDDSDRVVREVSPVRLPAMDGRQPSPPSSIVDADEEVLPVESQTVLSEAPRSGSQTPISRLPPRITR